MRAVFIASQPTHPATPTQGVSRGGLILVPVPIKHQVRVATCVAGEGPLAAGNFPNFAVIHFKNVIKRGAIGLGEHPSHSHTEKRMIIAARPTDVTAAGNHGEATVAAEIEMRLKQG